MSSTILSIFFIRGFITSIILGNGSTAYTTFAFLDAGIENTPVDAPKSTTISPSSIEKKSSYCTTSVPTIFSKSSNQSSDGLISTTGKTSIKNGLKASASLKLQGEWANFLSCIVETDAKIERLSYNPKKNFDYLPGFEANQPTSIKVLGPIETTIDGQATLKDLGTYDKNTNGNSVLLRVDYGRSRILLTGDLNKKSQRHIIESLSGNKIELAADVVKACHHGSDDCSYEFLQYVNAAATVISSGDDETHAHPRPNIVAASGVTGFQKIENDEMVTPLIYSTEISRSLKIGDPYEVNSKDYDTADGKIDVLLTNEAKTNIRYKHTSSGALNPTDKSKTMNRLKVVDGIVYGLVNVRTDGHKILCATLNEGKSKWEIKTFYSRF